MSVDCVSFAEIAPELALGLADSQERGELLEHANACIACQRYLDSLTFASERLLMAAPEVEPPSGFETRVLDRINHSDGTAVAVGPGSARRASRWRAAAVAAAVIVAVAGGVAVAHRPSRTVVAGTVAQGTILRADGTQAGAVRIADVPRPMIVITIDQPRRFEGRRTCELVLSDGRIVQVGSWSADDVAAGVWASGIGDELLHATQMNVRDAQGTVTASAALS
jgi:hypothetical protein